MSPWTDLGATNPVFAAPMAGGPTTPAMVVAAYTAGSLGFVAGGYKPVSVLAEQIEEVRRLSPLFGVNLFAPNPLPVDPDLYRGYADAIKREGDRFGIDLTAVLIQEDDDGWADKVDLLTNEPVPVVSFTFGIPPREIVDALRRQGSMVVQTVTSPAEGRAAAEAGADALAVQSHLAGGHFATLDPHQPSIPRPLTELVQAVRNATRLPVIAAGGLSSPQTIKEVLKAGADAVMLGTFLLTTDESGASATYKAALADRRHAPTAVTTAFSGRPARAVRNGFMDRYSDQAPLGYPALHHLTSPLRQAAAAAGDPDLINLWAGTGHSLGANGPVATALTELAGEL